MKKYLQFFFLKNCPRNRQYLSKICAKLILCLNRNFVFGKTPGTRPDAAALFNADAKGFPRFGTLCHDNFDV
jgi:hypothetical protein